MSKTVAGAVSIFGAATKSKLANPAVSGAPEDQLRGPLETLVRDLAEICGLPAGSVHLVGETSLAELKTRPDFAVTLSNALVGFIEVKAPGKGADPRRMGKKLRIRSNVFPLPAVNRAVQNGRYSDARPKTANHAIRQKQKYEAGNDRPATSIQYGISLSAAL